jgi:hypothetical protein
MTGTICDFFTHKSSRSYLNHLVYLIFALGLLLYCIPITRCCYIIIIIIIIIIKPMDSGST